MSPIEVMAKFNPDLASQGEAVRRAVTHTGRGGSSAGDQEPHPLNQAVPIEFVPVTAGVLWAIRSWEYIRWCEDQGIPFLDCVARAGRDLFGLDEPGTFGGPIDWHFPPDTA